MSEFSRDEDVNRYERYGNAGDWRRDERLRLHLTPKQRLQEDIDVATANFRRHAAQERQWAEWRKQDAAADARREPNTFIWPRRM